MQSNLKQSTRVPLRGTLKVIAATAILGCVVYAFSQQIASGSGTGEQGRAVSSAQGPRHIVLSEGTGPNGQKLIGRHYEGAPIKYVRPNVVQELLRYCMTTNGNSVGEAAEKAGNPAAYSRIIEVYCYHMMTTMRPDEQLHEMHDVWEIDAWQPRGAWETIRNAPSLAKEILTVDPSVASKVQAAWDRSTDKMMAPYREISARVSKEVGKDMQAYMRRYKEEATKYGEQQKRLHTAKPITTSVSDLMTEVRGYLTKPQREEFDRFYGAYERDANLVANGGTASFLAVRGR